MSGLALALALAGASAEPHIWPVAGLYGLERSACSSDSDNPTAQIDPAFCGMLSIDERSRLGSEFARLVQARFPNVEARFGEHLPASATPRARLNSTLVASLRLTRAAAWRVRRGAGVDGYLPITLTLDITNAATGEVLFSRTRTEIGQGTYAADAVDRSLAAELPRKLREAMNALVASAAADWRPYSQTATVLGRAGDYWVVDQGRAKGLRTGDMIGEDAEVVYSAADYAVVKPVLGTLREGQVLSRTLATPGAALSRPTVLAVAMDAPDGQAQYLAETLSDALADKAGFAPVPVNPSFTSLRGQAIGQAQQVSQESRSLPDYLAAFSVVSLKPAIFASNIPGVKIARYEAHVFVSLADASGRVVFTAHGNGSIEEKVAGVSFEVDQRQDTVVRNALLDAAGKLSAFKPQPLELGVGPLGSQVLVKDESGSVPVGAQLTVLRPLGTVGGLKIRVPIGELTTAALQPGGLAADKSGIESFDVKPGDAVIVESNGKPLQSRAPLVRCTAGQDASAIDDRGTVPFPLFARSADALFAMDFNGPVYLAQLASKLDFVKASFGDSWAKFQPARPLNAAMCFTPVVAVTAPQTVRGKPQRQVTIGYTLFRHGQKLAGAGLASSFAPTVVPADSDASVADAMLQHDLAVIALPLAEKAGAQLKAN